MAKPYSYDLRAKVINAIELDGVPKSEASALGTGGVITAATSYG
jgi:hypothetical protein